MVNLKTLSVIFFTIALGLVAHHHVAKNDELVRNLQHQLQQKDKQLTQTQAELTHVKRLLDVSEQELGYLNTHKTSVQVTAFCKQPNSNHFADGRSVSTAYAVKNRTLPGDVIVNVALSPVTQRRLNARMGDLLVIMDGRKKTLARFVDTTYAGESRPVIDVFFADPSNARHWGRRVGFYAVNISAKGSPFKLG